MDHFAHILIAIADDDALKTVERALDSADHDYKTKQVGDVESAVSALEGSEYDCALVDAGLGMNGEASLIERLRGTSTGTPAIAVANGATPSLVNDMLLTGALDCIALDEMSPERLGFAIAAAVRVSRAERRALVADAKLARQTLYDSLSELPNRVLFFDRLDQVISLGRREQRQVAVLTMDLNGFKQVNATLGHAIGDRLIQAVADRLRSVARDSDTVARLGGDEFAQVMPTGASVAGAIRAAEKAIDALREPIDIDGHHLATGISIGIAVFPTHGDDGATLMRHADQAMYAAKRNVTGYAIYSGGSDDADDGAHVRKLTLAGDLRNAIELEQMSLNFQPKVSFEDNNIAGVEALLRWNHPEHGMVGPDLFIPLAEQTGIIEQLTHWVLNAAMEQHAQWAAEGMFIPIAVNLSPVTLHEKEFPAQVAEILDRWKVKSSGLVLEITESAIMSDVARATDTVNQLHDMGLRISIDDFGTGYTSLSYIRRLPVSEIKVDKSFVLNMQNVNDDAVIVRSIVELGHNLGLSVVAEGIEDIETWNLLSDLKCNTAQGYFISRPVDAPTLTEWAADGTWNPPNI